MCELTHNTYVKCVYYHKIQMKNVLFHTKIKDKTEKVQQKSNEI